MAVSSSNASVPRVRKSVLSRRRMLSLSGSRFSK
jgi:hypothetical protein